MRIDTCRWIDMVVGVCVSWILWEEDIKMELEMLETYCR